MRGFDADVRLALSIVIGIATAFWGFMITFSDSPPEWSTVRLALYIIAWHVPGAFVMGWLLRRRWPLSLLAGLGAGLMLLWAPRLLAALFASIAVAGYLGSLLGVAMDRLKARP